ncbi:MAG: Na+/H+ antiporter subunit E [Actinomycetota bacterium]
MNPMLVQWLWLTTAWVALWADPSPGTALSGGALSALLVASFPPSGTRESKFRLRSALRFLLYFIWKLIEASAVVAWEVITPRSRINAGIVAIPIRGASRGLTTLVANAITLTPGTLTLEVQEEPTVLYVHVLHLRDIEEVRREVRHLEHLAIHAFGSPASRELR